MMTPDVNVILLDFPGRGKEMVAENEDGSYTILINARISYEEQVKAYHHALHHINNDDFRRDNVQAIEAIANKIATDPKTERIPSDKYLDRIKQLERERKARKRKMKRYEKKTAFLYQYCGGERGFFDRAENYKLYGDNL